MWVMAGVAIEETTDLVDVVTGQHRVFFSRGLGAGKDIVVAVAVNTGEGIAPSGIQVWDALVATFMACFAQQLAVRRV